LHSIVPLSIFEKDNYNMTGIDSQSKLYLIPVPLGEESSVDFVSESLLQLLNSLQLLVVENERTARRHLRKMGFKGAFDSLPMRVLDEHSSTAVVTEIAGMVIKAGISGLMSEAGVPGIADPGEELVREAHSLGIKVIPLPGPSSILMALMASGLNGEKFTFNGYLPVKPEARRKEIKTLEQISKGTAQIFIETPYRCQAMFADIMEVTNSSTRLCVASNIGLPDEHILTCTIAEWKKKPLILDKRLCIFILEC
jgi:16S rRNA (cytidine1402-2'-O)-methyltransferase